jgi:hypothetical protein
VSRESGNRSIFWRRGSAPPLRKEEVGLSPFSGARVLHLDGLMIEASIEAARQARFKFDQKSRNTKSEIRNKLKIRMFQWFETIA